MNTDKKSSEEIAKERADFLWKSAKYLASDAVCELHESHFTYWNKIRDKTIPSIIVVLEHLAGQFYYWTPPNETNIAQVKSIIAKLENIRLSKPETKNQITEPLDLVVNFRYN